MLQPIRVMFYFIMIYIMARNSISWRWKCPSLIIFWWESIRRSPKKNWYQTKLVKITLTVIISNNFRGQRLWFYHMWPENAWCQRSDILRRGKEFWWEIKHKKEVNPWRKVADWKPQASHQSLTFWKLFMSSNYWRHLFCPTLLTILLFICSLIEHWTINLITSMNGYYR